MCDDGITVLKSCSTIKRLGESECIFNIGICVLIKCYALVVPPYLINAMVI